MLICFLSSHSFPIFVSPIFCLGTKLFKTQGPHSNSFIDTTKSPAWFLVFQMMHYDYVLIQSHDLGSLIFIRVFCSDGSIVHMSIHYMYFHMNVIGIRGMGMRERDRVNVCFPTKIMQPRNEEEAFSCCLYLSLIPDQCHPGRFGFLVETDTMIPYYLHNTLAFTYALALIRKMNATLFRRTASSTHDRIFNECRDPKCSDGRF